MSGLRDRVAVAGVGYSQIGRSTGRSEGSLATIRSSGRGPRATGMRMEAEAFGRLCARSRAERRIAPLWPPAPGTAVER